MGVLMVFQNILASSSTKSQQLSLGTWCVLGVPTQCQRLQFYRGPWC